MAVKKVLALVMCVALLLTSGVNSQAVSVVATTEIVGLKTNLITNPSGIEGVPTFSWQMDSDIRSQAQTAYQIIVAKDSGFADVVWDSHKTEGGVSVGIACPATLAASTVYYWRVMVWDKDGNKFGSAPAKFETGLDGDSFWADSDWIQVGPEPKTLRLIPKEDVYYIDNQPETLGYIYMVGTIIKTIAGLLPRAAGNIVREPYSWLLHVEMKNFGSALFRNEFEAATGIKSATLTATGLGVFDVFINGERVGNIQPDGSVIFDELKPGYTYTGKRAFYYTYDVASMLAENGANTISAIVSNGWWRDSIVSNVGKQSALRAKLVIEYNDGTMQTVATGTSWKTKTGGPVLAATIYDGEVYDANADTTWQKKRA